jgi:DNA sulfur modification protein DndB
VNKGAALNKRVWTLFEKAGFKTQPNSQSTLEHSVELAPGKKRKVDLFAREDDLGVTIVASNKAGGIKDTFTGHVNDWEEIGTKAGASKVLMVITGKDLPPEDTAYAATKGMQIWDEKQLSYYEALAETIKQYAKYEIIHSLGIATSEEKNIHRVLALKVQQPVAGSGHDLFLFSVPVDHLLKTCVVFRRAQGNAEAYQRILRRERLPKVQDFVTRPDALLPTNIVVHLSDSVLVEDLLLGEFKDSKDRPLVLSRATKPVILNIPLEFSSLELIDGQHRLFGFVGTDPATRKSFDLLVTGVKSLNKKERQQAFVAINDNSRRMDPNLVAYLRYTKDLAECQGDASLMAVRVVVDLNDHTPFKGSIRLLDVGEQSITLKGFAGYDLKGLLGPRGLLRKYYPKNDPDEFLQVLRTYFSTVRSLFHEEWGRPDDYIISTNRGISAFLKLLRSMLRTDKRPLVYADFEKYLTALKGGIKTWKLTDLKKTYVGSQGWSAFHADLVEAVRRQYRTFRK